MAYFLLYNKSMSKNETTKKKSVPQIEKGSFKHWIVQVIIFVVTALIIFPLGDWLMGLIFTDTKFEFSVVAHILEPIIFGIAMGTIFWLFDRASAKKAKK